MQITHSKQFLRKRKFMLVLPLLTLPFITLAFWAMGGGKSNSQSESGKHAGLNLQLPEPKLADESRDSKLSFYDKAHEDSIKLRQEMMNDPYYKDGLDTSEFANSFTGIPVQSSYGTQLNPSPYYPPGATGTNEARIYERLDALNKVIAQPATSNANAPAGLPGSLHASSENEFSAEVDRLQSMMQMMGDSETDDPEMNQMAGVLDKILDIQHPERIKEKTQQRSAEKKKQVFAVNRYKNETMVSCLQSQVRIAGDTLEKGKQNGFYSIGNNKKEDAEDNDIPAVIHADQILINGSTVKLRLLTDIYVNGMLITKGNFVFGIASLENERLFINIPAIRSGNNLLPVSLTVYDMDGLAGIFIPGSISRDVARQSADQTMQGIELTSLDPSLKAQAAAAGIQAAKGLLSKKVKLQKAMVKAGYRVLLKDGNRQSN